MNRLNEFELSLGAVALYGVLDGLANFSAQRGLSYVYAGQRYLAKRLGRTERTVQRYLKELQRVGLVEVQRAGGRQHNRCVVLPPEVVLSRHRKEAGEAVDALDRSRGQVEAAAEAVDRAQGEAVPQEEEAAALDRGHVEAVQPVEEPVDALDRAEAVPVVPVEAAAGHVDRSRVEDLPQEEEAAEDVPQVEAVSPQMSGQCRIEKPDLSCQMSYQNIKEKRYIKTKREINQSSRDDRERLIQRRKNEFCGQLRKSLNYSRYEACACIAGDEAAIKEVDAVDAVINMAGEAMATGRRVSVNGAPMEASDWWSVIQNCTYGDVVDLLSRSRSYEVRNMRAYLLAALYNAGWDRQVKEAAA